MTKNETASAPVPDHVETILLGADGAPVTDPRLAVRAERVTWRGGAVAERAWFDRVADDAPGPEARAVPPIPDLPRRGAGKNATSEKKIS